jgi:hypothetical protein
MFLEPSRALSRPLNSLLVNDMWPMSHRTGLANTLWTMSQRVVSHVAVNARVGGVRREHADGYATPGCAHANGYATLPVDRPVRARADDVRRADGGEHELLARERARGRDAQSDAARPPRPSTRLPL